MTEPPYVLVNRPGAGAPVELGTRTSVLPPGRVVVWVTEPSYVLVRTFGRAAEGVVEALGTRIRVFPPARVVV